MSTEDEIDAAAFCNRYKITVVERVRIRVMRDENSPCRLPCRRSHEIFFYPRKNCLNPCTQGSICRDAGIDSIHLKQCPWIAVHNRKMCHSIVKGEGLAALHTRQPLHLRFADKRIEEWPVIVISVGINYRQSSEEFRDFSKPIIRILVMLIARTKGDISRMQEEVRLNALCCTLKCFCCVKQMGV